MSNWKLIGFSVGTPACREIDPPELSTNYADSQGINATQTCTRKLLCLDRDAETVKASIGQGYCALSQYTLDSSGALVSSSLGSGWKVDNVQKNSSGFKGLCVIVVSYKRTIPVVFLPNELPSGITIECAAGVGTIKYNASTIATYDTGSTEEGPGWQIKLFDWYLAEKTALIDYTKYRSNRQISLSELDQKIQGIELFCNAHLVARYTPAMTDYGGIGTLITCNELIQIGESAPTADEIKALKIQKGYKSVTNIAHSATGYRAWIGWYDITGFINYANINKTLRWKTTGGTYSLVWNDAAIISFTVPEDEET